MEVGVGVRRSSQLEAWRRAIRCLSTFRDQILHFTCYTYQYCLSAILTHLYHTRIMTTVKDEPQDEPEGLLPPRDIIPPPHFEKEEWEKLTEVIISFFYHI